MECLMQRVARKLVAVFALEFLLVLVFSEVCFAQNYERTYFLLEGQSTYQLTLSITPSLYEYYQQKSHRLTQYSFASFVTPYSIALVASDIRSIFSDEEDFVNAVLMLVHQIPYEIVDGAEYPVETFVENRGDCDLLSYVAASLMKAQGLDVVLFYYEHESHMNVGVGLPSPPRDARTVVSYVDYGGVRYYVAECTGDDWQDGWRVGEYPSELKGTEVTVVTLDSCEQVAPGQVSSSFGTLGSSVISLTVSSGFVIEESVVKLTGQVSVLEPGGTVTLYATAGGGWFAFGKANLDSSGHYAFSWGPSSFGQYCVKASWSGNDEYAGADSGVVSVFVIPKVWVFVVGGAVVLAVIGLVVFLMYRTTRPQELEAFVAVSQ